MKLSGRFYKRAAKKEEEPQYLVKRNKEGMEICPVCQKPTAPLFLWRFDDTTGMCLECFHKLPEKEQKYHESHLSGGNRSGGYVWKTVGSLALIMVVLVGGVWFFYKPHPTTVAKKDEAGQKALDGKGGKSSRGGGSEGGGPKDGDKDDKSDDKDGDKTTDETTPDGKKKDGQTIAEADGKGNGKTHMAPTVQAVAAGVRQLKGQGKQDTAAPSSVAKIINEAQAAADALHPQSADNGGAAAAADSQPAIHPKSEIKEKAAQTKEAALSVASAIIEKHDQDGTKTAELLGRIGQVSTTFADVATKLTDGVPTTGKGSGSSSTGGSQKLGADPLAAQGRSGYDPAEAVERELAEEAGAAKQKTVQTQGDARANPGAPGQPGAAQVPALNPQLPGALALAGNSQSPTDSGDAVGRSGSGISRDSTALAVASLPSAFVNAASGGPNGVATGADGTPGGVGVAGAGADPLRMGRLSVVVLSMKGDLLFDFNSAGLRPQASAQLHEVAEVLARRPELPVLIRGYTDSKGTTEANLALSKKRAESVREWLMSKGGIKTQNITVEGLGATDPVAPNQNADGSDNPSGREKNRRVTVTIPQFETQPQRQAKL